MKLSVPLIAGLTLLTGAVALAQGSDAPLGTPTGRSDDETAVTAKASHDTINTNYQENQAALSTAPDAYKAGRYSDAVKTLEDIVKKTPGDDQAQNLLAFCLLKLNRPADAAPHLEALIKLKPDNLDARRYLAQTYLMTNRPADAVPVLQALLAKSPKDAQAQFDLGSALHQTGQDGLAAEAFRKDADLDPKNAAVWLNAGTLYTVAGAYAKAIPALQQAIALKTDDPYDAHAALAQCYTATKDNTRAMQEFMAASQAKPDDPGLIYNLAVLQEQAGQDALAQQNYQKALALKPSDANLAKSAQVNLALLLAKDGTPDAAIPALQQADPGNADVQNALGRMYEKQGKKADAAAAYKKALAIDPTRADSKMALARVSK